MSPTPPAAPPLPGPRRRRPAHWRTLAALIALLIAIYVPAVSAEVIVSETITFPTDTSNSGINTPSGGGAIFAPINGIRINNIQNHENLVYITAVTPGNTFPSLHAGENAFTYTMTGDSTQKTGRVYITRYTNTVGSITQTRAVYFFDEWHIGTLSGSATVSLSISSDSASLRNNLPTWGCDVVYTNGGYFMAGDYGIASYKNWANHLGVVKQNEDSEIYEGYLISLNRTVAGISSKSVITISKDDATVAYNDHASNSYQGWFAVEDVDKVTIDTQLGKIFEYRLGLNEVEPGETTGETVNIYVRNSQTGALLANASVVIQDTTTDPWTEVANQTLASGQGTISLAKDPGIHLTQYHVAATVPGYQQVVPALFFRVVGPTDVVVEMEPVEGGPVNEDNAFLRFYVRDTAGNGVSAANVQVGDVMRFTNAQGYAQFEVPKNSTYEYTIAKFRYTAVSGRATVLDDESYTVSVTLSPGAVPTYTPPVGTPTPDTRSSAEKAASGLDFILDNAENFGAMAAMILLIYMGYWMVPKK